MLEQQNDGIYELNNAALVNSAQTITTGDVTFGGLSSFGHSSNCLDWNGYGYYHPQPIYWNSYPVYVCTDKTKKAIEVLKALQADKMLTCNSVARFIELVEKISAIL